MLLFMNEKVKEYVTILKNAFSIFLTAFLATIAYVFINLKSLSRAEFIIACAGITSLFGAIVVVLWLFAKYSDRLGGEWWVRAQSF